MNNSGDQEILKNFKRKKVYFERQAYDKLCGVHCLNSLMQGPYFNPFSLSEIAQKLDEMEKQLLGEDAYVT
jgi:ataxin-3